MAEHMKPRRIEVKSQDELDRLVERLKSEGWEVSHQTTKEVKR